MQPFFGIWIWSRIRDWVLIAFNQRSIICFTKKAKKHLKLLVKIIITNENEPFRNRILAQRFLYKIIAKITKNYSCAFKNCSKRSNFSSYTLKCVLGNRYQLKHPLYFQNLILARHLLSCDIHFFDWFKTKSCVGGRQLKSSDLKRAKLTDWAFPIIFLHI